MKQKLPSPKTPLGIFCCPLSAIIEDKIRDQERSGMLSMYGGCKTRSDGEAKVALSKCESDFLSDKITLIYGHPESFATEMGGNILETNEFRICLYTTDEVGFFNMGPRLQTLDVKCSRVNQSIFSIGSIDLYVCNSG